MDRVKTVFNISSMNELNELMASQGRQLRDTYADSLVYTNILLSKRFGNEERKVPAHMPHYMNKQVLERIEHMIASEFTNTRQHKFRSSDDLQYSFMYMYFLRQFEKEKQDKYYDSLWDLYLDTDHDGFLNANELQTLAAMVYQDDMNEQYAVIDGMNYM